MTPPTQRVPADHPPATRDDHRLASDLRVWQAGVDRDVSRLDATLARIEGILATRLPAAPAPASAPEALVIAATHPTGPDAATTSLRAKAPKKKKSKGEHAAAPASTLPTTVPLQLSAMFPTKDRPDQCLLTVVVPDAIAAHLVGKDGRGLRQIHDISGARVRAFHMEGGPAGERHVSIRGTDIQVGDALAVLGKRIARRRVRTPAPKGKPSTTPPAPAPVAPVVTALPAAPRAPAGPGASERQPNAQPPSSFLPPPSHMPSHAPTHVRGPTFNPRAAPPSAQASPSHPPYSPVIPSVRMTTAAPPTPSVPSVRMATPSSSGSRAPTPSYTPMDIGGVTHKDDLPGPCPDCAEFDYHAVWCKFN